MDTRQVNALAERYKERVVRLSPPLFQSLGIIRNSISLKLGEYSVSCAPFDLSISGASLLAILNDREIAFFGKMIGSPQKLMIARISPYASKPVNFFIPLRVESIAKPVAGSTYCFVKAAFGPAPQELTEMLVAYFVECDQAEAFFGEAKDEPIAPEEFGEVLGCSRLSLLNGEYAADGLKVLYLSAKRVRVFGEFSGKVPVLGDALELEPLGGDALCSIKGTCDEVTPLAEAPGFYFLGLAQAFSAGIAAKLLKLSKRGAKVPPEA
jgi:hypothetical protein